MIRLGNYSEKSNAVKLRYTPNRTPHQCVDNIKNMKGFPSKKYEDSSIGIFKNSINDHVTCETMDCNNESDDDSDNESK